MSTIEVQTQQELDAALDSAEVYDVIAIVGSGWLELTRRPTASVTAYGSASVRASGSASVTAYDTASVRATKYVSVHKRAQDRRVTVAGGVLIEAPEIDSPEAWCDYHGVEATEGSVTLYKALDDDWSTPNARAKGLVYELGTTVKAPDWRKARKCGNGLHACATPHEALAYNETATRFVEVRAPLASLVVIDESKVKAPCLEVVAEVDVRGRPLETGMVAP